MKNVYKIALKMIKKPYNWIIKKMKFFKIIFKKKIFKRSIWMA